MPGEVEVELLKGQVHFEDGGHGVLGVAGIFGRSAVEKHDAVAKELVDVAAVGADDGDHLAHVDVQEMDSAFAEASVRAVKPARSVKTMVISCSAPASWA